MRVYGIRGATTVKANEKDAIIQETELLLHEIIRANNLKQEDVISILFTTTPDLTAEFPAKACALMGWNDTPRIGAVEADVPHGVPRCIRVLIHAYLDPAGEIKQVYLNEAIVLRPDLAAKPIA